MIKSSAALLLLCLCSCASIVAPGPDLVPTKSDPAGATVKVDGVESGKTPCRVIAHRKNFGNILFELDGYEPIEVKRPKVSNGWVVGNIFFGGLIGLVIDVASGNNQKHSEIEVSVILKKKGDGPSIVVEAPSEPIQHVGKPGNR